MVSTFPSADVALSCADEFCERRLAHRQASPLGADPFANLFWVKWHGMLLCRKAGGSPLPPLMGKEFASCYCPPMETLHKDGMMVDINGGHPFWGILRIAVIFCGLTLFL